MIKTNSYAELFMQYKLSQDQIIDLNGKKVLLNRGYITARGMYIDMAQDQPELFDTILANPKEICAEYPQYFDLFNAILDVDDEFYSK